LCLSFWVFHNAFLFTMRATCSANLIHLDHSNYTWRRVQAMKLLIIRFPSTPCHFIRRDNLPISVYETKIVVRNYISAYRVDVSSLRFQTLKMEAICVFETVAVTRLHGS
jgi:hypothetical protein